MTKLETPKDEGMTKLETPKEDAKPLWQEAKELHLIFAKIYRSQP